MNKRIYKIIVWITLAAMLFTTVLMGVGAFM